MSDEPSNAPVTLHERTMRFLGLTEAEKNRDDNRREFVRVACGRELPVNATADERRAFEEVNAQLREIAKSLDPPNRLAYDSRDKYKHRECLCGKLAVLVTKNPELAAHKLTEDQVRIAATVLGMAVEYNVPAESLDEEGEGKVCTTQKKMDALKALAKATVYGAGIGLLATGSLLVGATVPIAGLIAMRWGAPAVSGVYYFLTDKYHVGALRRALADYTRTFWGGQDTEYLRDYFVRYITMDATTLESLLTNRFPFDNEKSSVNAFLLAEVTRQLQKLGNRRTAESINDVIGQVLADFTFGGPLYQRLGAPKMSVFLPTGGEEHVGLRGAKDQDEYYEMKQAFAETWLRPTAPMPSVNDIPEDIAAFWSAALASALDQRTTGAIPDEVLYTMYYFVWRYTDAYGLLDKLLCPRARAEFAQPLLQTGTGRALSSASATFRCIFEDYERRYKETLSTADALLYTLNLK